jgi:hypothetical protein
VVGQSCRRRYRSVIGWTVRQKAKDRRLPVFVRWCLYLSYGEVEVDADADAEAAIDGALLAD